MRKAAMIGALLAGFPLAVLAAPQRRIYGADNIERYLRQQKSDPVHKRGRRKAERRGGAKLRSNRLTISRRVRRKHRRAA